MVPLDRALVSFYTLSVLTMSLSAVVWPQFAMQVFRGVTGSLRYVARNVSISATTLTFWAQTTKCSTDHKKTVMDAGCQCAPRVQLANL